MKVYAGMDPRLPLDKIAAYLAQQIETSSMVKGAMVYPGIIGTMAIGTTGTPVRIARRALVTWR